MTLRHGVTMSVGIDSALRRCLLIVVVHLSVLHLCLPAGAVGTSDDTRYRFARLTAQDGLSHNVVYTILQDDFGFMWIGTENGLNKYDGNSFTVYEHVPSDTTTLADSRITTLLEDSRGNLWIGTRWGGLHRFNRESETFTRYAVYECAEETCNRPDGLNDSYVSALLEDESGRIWIGTFGGLSRLDPSTGQFVHFQHDPADPKSISDNKVWCLAETSDGDLLVGTWASGLSMLDHASGTFRRFRSSYEYGPRLIGDRIRALSVDRDGSVWMGISGGGLNRVNLTEGTVETFLHDSSNSGSLPDNKVYTLLRDSRGVLWAGTYDGGLTSFDQSRNRFRIFRHDPEDPTSISSNVVSALYEDRSGNLWIGSEQGISLYNLAQERHQHYTHAPNDPNSLSNSAVSSLQISPNNGNVLWIGTHGGGIDRFYMDDQRLEQVASTGDTRFHLSSDLVTSLHHDAEGTLWVGTNGGGLNEINTSTGETSVHRRDLTEPYSIGSDNILDVLVDRRGRTWVGTDGGGLGRLDPELGTFVRFEEDPFDPTAISDNSIETIYEGRDGTLWVGTVDGGLNRIAPGSNTFESFRHTPGNPQSISHDRVVSIYEDDSGRIWVGTYGGLNHFDPESQTFRQYTRDDGLPAEPYLAITGASSGGLWLTTANRLTYFLPESGLVRHFTDRHGLSPNHYSTGALVTTKHGSLVLGGRNGFSHFYPPVEESDQDQHPPLVVTSLKKMDEVVDREIFSQETISLSYTDRYFTLEFAVLDYTDPEKHQYQYRLEGYDGEWQHAAGSIGRASYANFRALRDEYIFRVRAANSKGAWNTMWLRIRVMPPWWQTLWFKISSVLAIGLIGGTVVTYRYNRQKREKAETLRLLAEGRERERQYLARELHDSPLQNLYSIRHKLEVLARNPSDPSNSRVMEEAHSVVDKTAEDLRILCGELRPPSLGPFGLEKAIRAHVRTVQRAHPNLNAILELTPDGQTLPEHLRHSLFRIYQSAVTNVLRHANATRLWVTFRLENSKVMLEVRDDGRGFNVPKSWLTLARSQHFGLLGISEWAEAIEADLTVDSKPGHGTTVRVVAPCSIDDIA